MSIIKVASHAGVSTATVSRVLNNFPGVGSETAKQVRASLQALNYDASRLKRTRRNTDGRSDRPRKRTNAIAILTIGQTRDWLQLPVMAATVAGISRGAKDYGFQLVLDEILDPAKPSDTVCNGKVDGAIIFLSSLVQQFAAEDVFNSIGRRLPLVWVMGGGSSISSIDHISLDNRQIGYLAFNYLKNQQCQNVAYACLNPDWPVMQARGHGFAAAAREAHVPSSAYLLDNHPLQSHVYGSQSVIRPKLEELIDHLVNAKPKITGIFIGNDAATVQIYPMLQRRGIQPGRDITVVSCDNEEVRLSGLHPRPASIDVGSEEAGWRAVHRLASRLENMQEPPVQISVSPRLVLPANAAELDL